MYIFLFTDFPCFFCSVALAPCPTRLMCDDWTISRNKTYFSYFFKSANSRDRSEAFNPSAVQSKIGHLQLKRAMLLRKFFFHWWQNNIDGDRGDDRWVLPLLAAAPLFCFSFLHGRVKWRRWKLWPFTHQCHLFYLSPFLLIIEHPPCGSYNLFTLTDFFVTGRVEKLPWLWSFTPWFYLFFLISLFY